MVIVVNLSALRSLRLRVLIERELDRRRFSTVGVHANIIEAELAGAVRCDRIRRGPR